jgi:predicted nuclease of predicted toxin-antitoxin system
MRLLLDECLPVLLRHELPGHEVRTVRYMGWTGIENGELLALAADAGFDAFVTVDKKIGQHLRAATPPVSVVVLHAPSNSLKHLRALTGQLLNALSSLPPRTVLDVK